MYKPSVYLSAKYHNPGSVLPSYLNGRNGEKLGIQLEDPEM